VASRGDGRVQAIRADLTRLDVRRGELVRAFTDGGDPNVLRMASDALDRQRKELEAELGAASARSPLEGYSEAPGVAAARAWVAASGFGEEITVSDAGRMRVYDLELDAAQFFAMSGEDAFDLLTSAAIRAELGDPEELEP
jgi:hypothetical protein